MPIYTYRCENCGVRFDHTAKFTDPPLVRCPECDHKSLKKVYQPVGIIFKGSGFYATDHKSPSGGKNLPSHEEHKPSSESAASSSSESKGDSKPASAENKSATDTKAGSSASASSTPRES